MLAKIPQQKTQHQDLQHFNPDLFSNLRRNINLLKQQQTDKRKTALKQILQIITVEQLPGNLFEEIGHLIIKDILKSFSDHSQNCRQLANNIVIELLPRSSKIGSFLPYIFTILIDRTNSHDLEGISNLPEKMRPPPGQKPKVIVKIVQSCQEIRLLYCKIIRTIVGLLEHEGDQIRKHLDDIINITRALIMDPAPEVQKTACQTLEVTCKLYKDLLLHYTQIMGRAVLLPLISKKSKIRIAGLKALTAIFWCGLYKYNAFVFENLIGFRDPNSVPIKDFYEPSHNINYLATFITDSNNRVRLQFMKNIKIWVCDLDDKYDHHGKIVPYLLSGLFDNDQEVKQTAVQAIEEIGRQIERERQKDFRQNKQFAIDAKWVWEGKVAGLPVDEPLKGRPSLGSRFFIRGHVRKFWNALYRQVRDINIQNRKRACNLAVYGAIYTQNYLTQYLDDMIPNLLTAIIAPQKQKQAIQCSKKIQKIFYYIGRYCQQSTYLHIMKSSLQGKVVQNQQFLKGTFIALKNLIKGSLQAIPPIDSSYPQGLFHKLQQIKSLLQMIRDSNSIEQIYLFNCRQAQDFILELIKGLKLKAKKAEIRQILEEYFIIIGKLWCVGYYEQTYRNCFKLEQYVTQTNENVNQNPQVLLKSLSINSLSQNKQQKNEELNKNTVQNSKIYSNDKLHSSMTEFIYQLSGQNQLVQSLIEQYFSELYQNPPSLMDSDWKFIIVLNNYFLKKALLGSTVSNNSENQQSNSSTVANTKNRTNQKTSVLFTLTQQIIGESLSYNRSVQILNFCFKYICWVFDQKDKLQKNIQSNNEKQTLNEDLIKSSYKQLSQVLQRSLTNFNKFKPLKKVPVYDQHLLEQNKKPQKAPQGQNMEQGEKEQQMRMNEQTFYVLYKNASEAFRKFYSHKIILTNYTLAQMLVSYVGLSSKVRRNDECALESLKTIWIVFEREAVNQEFPLKLQPSKSNNQPLTKTKTIQLVINYIVQRIQTMIQPQHKRIQLIFSILQNILKSFPVFLNAATPLPNIYPDYNTLFQKLIRYAMDEKDIQLKQKYVQFFKKANKKMKTWFELEYKMAMQSQKFIKAQFLRDTLNLN